MEKTWLGLPSLFQSKGGEGGGGGGGGREQVAHFCCDMPQRKLLGAVEAQFLFGQAGH